MKNKNPLAKAVDATADTWNECLAAIDHMNNKDDINDIHFHIHAIQNILMANMYQNIKANMSTPDSW